jgi:predicted RNA polymerase sigma factor
VELDSLYREHAPAIVASLVRSFGPKRLDLVEAAVQEAFVAAIEQYLSTERSKRWISEVDALLETMSWDDIWKRMNDLMNKTINTKTINHENKSQAYV